MTDAPPVFDLGDRRDLPAAAAGHEIRVRIAARPAGPGTLVAFLVGAAACTVAAVGTIPLLREPRVPLALAGLFVLVWTLGAVAFVRLALGERASLQRRRQDECRELRVRLADVVVKTGERELVLDLADALRSPQVQAAGGGVLALIAVRAAIPRMRPGEPRRIVLEALAIEEAARGGWGDPDAPDVRPRLFVWLLRERTIPRLAGVYTSERRLLDELPRERADPWVFAVPTVRDAAGGWRAELIPAAPQPWYRPPDPKDR